MFKAANVYQKHQSDKGLRKRKLTPNVNIGLH